MTIVEQIRERLRKAEALYLGAATQGERAAAGAAIERLKARLSTLQKEDPPAEMKVALADSWSVKLFVALCRRYGLKPYRYARQRRTTVMVRTPRRFFDAVVWPQFTALHDDLAVYLDDSTERVIRESVYADASDAETAPGLEP